MKNTAATNDYYPEVLLREEAYNILLKYMPSDIACRPHVINAIKEWERGRDANGVSTVSSMLEIGPGHGEMTKSILAETSVHATLVELDPKAAASLKKELHEYADRIEIVVADAITWIKQQPSESFDVFTASWVIHNFPKNERDILLAEISRVLKPKGLFVIFDKIHPDSKEEIARLWEIHQNRLSILDELGYADFKKEFFAHEERDMAEPYVWYENDFLKEMADLGFKDTKIVMRSERDVVAVGTK